MTRFAIALDIGGTKIEVCLIDDRFKVIDKIRVPSENEKGPDGVMGNILQAIGSVKKGDIEGIGVGICGIQVKEKGTIMSSPNLALSGYPIKRTLEKKFNTKVYMENDANCMALSENRFGAGKGTKNMVGVIIGSGFGAGIIINGRLYTGTTESAGEIGHTVIVPNGRECLCGRKGCLEAYCSGNSVMRIFRERIKKEKSSLMDAPDLNSDNILKEARKGDLLCKEIMDDFFLHLSIGIGNVISTLNPEMIVFGGGVSKMDIYPELRKRVKDQAVRFAAEKVKLVPAKLGDSSGVLGAAALVFMPDEIY